MCGYCQSQMDASLKHRWIVETAQVRKVFQEPDGRIVYEEGRLCIAVSVRRYYELLCVLHVVFTMSVQILTLIRSGQ